MKSINVGVGKRKSVAVDRGKGNTSVPAKNSNPDGDDDYEEYEQEEYTCVVKKLMLSLKCGDETQCHKLFRTRCTMKRSLCVLIIDSGSQENIISKDVMEATIRDGNSPQPICYWVD